MIGISFIFRWVVSRRFGAHENPREMGERPKIGHAKRLKASFGVKINRKFGHRTGTFRG